ncbi:MAG TPA: hypothetical protein ENJ95_04875, partial [Bacteroidetes bacterium]|nr:hypothetical protein [Bacteroidota bacterium]
MKPLFTIALLFAYLISFGQQGVELKVKILPDNQTYQVLLRATADDPTGNNMITAGAQITLRVPTGGFQTGTVTNLAGTWSNSPPLIAPAENPGFDYFFFTLDALTTAVTIQQGLEVPLFNFTNAGSCTGAMELYDNDTDPIQFPNSLNVNLANTITVVGFGLGNSYLGNYNAISADCGHTYECEDQPGEFIDVTDLVFTRPDCGVANGSIFIEATGSLEPGFPLQYSINGFNNANWQNDPLFTGLQSGDIYEIYLRFAGGFCRFHLGDYELLPPPVGTLQSADLQMPDCGMSNGSITMTAFPSNGAILQYGYSIPSVMPVPVYQDSPILADLAAGTYILWLRDRDNPDCETNVGNYILDEDCTAVPCSNFDLQSLGNGRYSVSLTPGETLNAPNNVTESLSVTIKVPTGGFNLGNLVSDVTNVSFAVANTVVAPAEAPGFDYITIELSSTNTSDIPYIAGNNTLLFSFENTGTCEGADISIVPTDDPYLLSGANIGLDVTVTGSMVNECIGTGTAACDAVPNMCPLTYQLDKLPNGDFQVSLLPSVTLPAGGMSTTSTLQVTIKTPTGGFIPDQITSLVTGVTIVDAGSATAPTEDPLHDYFSFSMSEAFTLSIPYTSGVIVPLFTFKNIGPCVSGDIFLMDNATDPFFVQPNSQGVNVGQIMTVLGIGASINVCLSSQASVECQGDPCLSLVAGFTAPDGCQGENITFTNTTTSNEANLSWEWNFGDGTPTS